MYFAMLPSQRLVTGARVLGGVGCNDWGIKSLVALRRLGDEKVESQSTVGYLWPGF